MHCRSRILLRAWERVQCGGRLPRKRVLPRRQCRRHRLRGARQLLPPLTSTPAGIGCPPGSYCRHVPRAAMRLHSGYYLLWREQQRERRYALSKRIHVRRGRAAAELHRCWELVPERTLLPSLPAGRATTGLPRRPTRPTRAPGRAFCVGGRYYGVGSSNPAPP
jgi:hypothetical protein